MLNVFLKKNKCPMKTKLYLVLRNGLEKENKQKKMKKDKSTTYRKKINLLSGSTDNLVLCSACAIQCMFGLCSVLKHSVRLCCCCAWQDLWEGNRKGRCILEDQSRAVGSDESQTSGDSDRISHAHACARTRTGTLFLDCCGMRITTLNYDLFSSARR